ncbi:MAG: hypothetical protein ACOVSI_01715, partial [Gemmatimonas sp.]
MAVNESIFLSAHEAHGQQSVQRCDDCGHDLDERDASPACPACGGLLAIIHRAPLDVMGAPLEPKAVQHAFVQHCCAMPMG